MKMLESLYCMLIHSIHVPATIIFFNSVNLLFDVFFQHLYAYVRIQESIPYSW